MFFLFSFTYTRD